MVPRPPIEARVGDTILDKRTAISPTKTDEASDPTKLRRAGESPDGAEDVDFASSRAARRKMQLWLTVVTTAAAIAILAVVWMSMPRAG